MEKYLKAVSEMYSQFEKREVHPLEKREVHPLEKYVGRLVSISGEKAEVVGYNDSEYATPLIVDASKIEGWYCDFLGPQDVVFKKCERYWYVSINDLID